MISSASMFQTDFPCLLQSSPSKCENDQMQHFKVTVIPCGCEDQNDFSEEPYELVLARPNNTQHNLKDILNNNQSIWDKIFGKYMANESGPNFSLYRTPYDADPESNGEVSTDNDLFLHILYMKSSEKTLTRNYNA
jgi:hypothetical protein